MPSLALHAGLCSRDESPIRSELFDVGAAWPQLATSPPVHRSNAAGGVLISRVRNNQRALLDAAASVGGQDVEHAGEWLLDNCEIVE
jgi:hypothetical protein